MTLRDCVVIGAGFAGLSCARELHDRGLDVQVIEARDRLGGRTCTAELAGRTVDVGGQWIGNAHTELAALARSAGVTLRDQFVDGDKLLHLGPAGNGSLRRYSGLLPKVNPLSLIELELMIRSLNAKQKTLDLAAPWAAPQAAAWDRETLATWARRRLHTASGRAIFEIAVRAVMTSDPGSLSLLGFLFYCASNQSFDFLTSARGGAQHQVVEGGMPQVAQFLARPLLELSRVHCGQPALAIHQQADDSLEVVTPQARLACRRVVCTVPPALQNRIDFQPALPPARFRLASRMPMGSVIKCLIAYPRPFWREAGLSGEAISHQLPFNTVFDASPTDGSFGILVGFIDGAPAQHWTRQSAEQRQQAVIDSLARYFGEAAREPMDYVEKDWLDDEWARGCYVGLMTPGLLTELGPALREPVGAIHWAGTETAREFCGYIEGAIRSGQRAAAEVAAILRP